MYLFSIERVFKIYFCHLYMSAAFSSLPAPLAAQPPPAHNFRIHPKVIRLCLVVSVQKGLCYYILLYISIYYYVLLYIIVDHFYQYIFDKISRQILSVRLLDISV